MGYQRPMLRLIFEDPQMAGLEVQCRRVKVAQMARVTQWMADTDKMGDDIEEQKARLDEVLAILADHIHSWNLEDEDGVPVPADMENLKEQDFPFVLAIMQAWMDSAVGVSAPLAPTSSDGKPSGEVPIPMETLSPSLVN